jgi:hypothetical protein
MKNGESEEVTMMILKTIQRFSGKLTGRLALVLMALLCYSSASAVTAPPVSELAALKSDTYVIATATASELTYTENFHNDPDGEELTVSYWSEDDQPLAVKRLEFTDGGGIPDLEMIDLRRKRGHRVIRDGNTLDVSIFRIEADGSRKQIKSYSVEVKEPTIVDAGFHRHILKHWDSLVAGKSRRVNFLRVEKGNYIPLVIKKRTCDIDDGAVCFRIALNNFLLKNLVPDIKLAYDPVQKRLIRYSGLGPLNKPNGKGMTVQIAYDYPR